MKLKDYLQKLNLDDKEISIYLINLEIGRTSIVEIKEKSQLPRTTVYQILERLRDHGLIDINETKTRRIYTPKPPEQILTLLKDKKSQLEEDIDLFSTALPELRQIFDLDPAQPRVAFFPQDEIKHIFEDIFNSNPEEIRLISSIQELQAILGERYLTRWLARRAEMRINSKIILTCSADKKDHLKLKDKEDHQRVRYAPPTFNGPSSVIVYGTKVAILTNAGQRFGTVITSSEYSQTMKSWYDELWRRSVEKVKITLE